MNIGEHPPACRDISHLLLGCGVIASAAFIAFLPSLNHGFVNWDDNFYVINNPDIRAFTLRNLSKVFSSTYVGNYQPLTMLAYMAEYCFFRLNPAPYHSASLVLHVVNAILVFALFLGLSRHHLTSLIVAILFAVHPLRVESVAWIAEQKDLLSAFFYLLSLLFYVWYLRERRPGFYWLCMVLLLFSLLSKPMAVSQPFVLILIDYLYNGRVDKKTLSSKAALFAIVAAFAILAILTQRISGATPRFHQVSTLQRLCVPFYGLVFYVAKTLLPLRLCSLYPLPPNLTGGTMVVLFVAPLLVLGGAVVVYCVRAYSRVLVFGCLFYLVTLLPVLQIVPIGDAIVAERYTYIPALGLCFALAALCRFLFEKKLKSTMSRSALGVGLCATIIVLACATYYRCDVWKDSLSLWNDVIAKYPSAVSYNYRGSAYSIHREPERAIEDFDQAIRLDPGYVEAYDNRGFAHLAKRDYDLAIEDHTDALKLNPRDALAYNNRGLAYKYKGDYGRAVEDFENAIRLIPTALLYNNRGATRDAMGEHQRAVEDFDEATRLNPDYAPAWHNRGLSYKAMGDDIQALNDFRKACDLGHRAACQLLRRQ
jgi:Flp pilus assembly protein TadD